MAGNTTQPTSSGSERRCVSIGHAFSRRQRRFPRYTHPFLEHSTPSVPTQNPGCHSEMPARDTIAAPKNQSAATVPKLPLFSQRSRPSLPALLLQRVCTRPSAANRAWPTLPRMAIWRRTRRWAPANKCKKRKKKRKKRGAHADGPKVRHGIARPEAQVRQTNVNDDIIDIEKKKEQKKNKTKRAHGDGIPRARSARPPGTSPAQRRRQPARARPLHAMARRTHGNAARREAPARGDCREAPAHRPPRPRPRGQRTHPSPAPPADRPRAPAAPEADGRVAPVDGRQNVRACRHAQICRQQAVASRWELDHVTHLAKLPNDKEKH